VHIFRWFGKLTSSFMILSFNFEALIPRYSILKINVDLTVERILAN
jgi:hypothetical protein